MRSRTLWMPLFLVLLPATGVVVLGMVGLWKAVRAAETTARVEAEKGALATAKAIRQALTRPGTLRILDPRWRFRVEAGKLQIPAEIGWLKSPPVDRPGENIPLPVQDLLEQARAKEFGEKKAVEAAGLYAQALEETPEQDPGRPWVALNAAWNAHRLDRSRDRDAFLRELDAPLQDPPRSMISGTLLLNAAAGRPFPPWAVSRFARFPASEGSVVLERIEELAGKGTEVENLSRHLSNITARRAILLEARSLLPSLLESSGPQLQGLAKDLVLYHPESDQSGEGAILPPGELAQTLQDSNLSIPWSGKLVTGADYTEAAIPVVPHIGIVTGSVLEPALWSRPGSLMILLGSLGLFLVVGMFFSVRAMRRESAALQARGDFLNSVTHEIKTPLSSIRLLSEMLLDGRGLSPERKTEYYRNLTAESGRLGMLVENVLDLGRMERGERAYDRQPHPIAEILKEAIRFFEPLAARDQMELHVTLPRKDVLGWVDRDTLVQVFLNVLENARRYAALGKKLDVLATWKDGKYFITFRDYGPGVSEEERQAIFEKFSRGRAAAEGGNPGVGLGLYLCRNVLRNHGGDIVLIPTPDGGPGAAFQVSFSLEKQEEMV